jgi:RNase P/RNase MRP subunit p29
MLSAPVIGEQNWYTEDSKQEWRWFRDDAGNSEIVECDMSAVSNIRGKGWISAGSPKRETVNVLKISNQERWTVPSEDDVFVIEQIRPIKPLDFYVQIASPSSRQVSAHKIERSGGAIDLGGKLIVVKAERNIRRRHHPVVITI